MTFLNFYTVHFQYDDAWSNVAFDWCRDNRNVPANDWYYSLGVTEIYGFASYYIYKEFIMKFK
jgi:hypothetical protein